jgi:hypothetical protein
MLNGFPCATEKTAAILRQHDLGTGGLYPLELVRSEGVTLVEGPFWALNFGAKKNALEMEASRSVDGVNCTPKLCVKDDEFASHAPRWTARTSGAMRGWRQASSSAPVSAQRCRRQASPRFSTCCAAGWCDARLPWPSEAETGPENLVRQGLTPP